MASHLQQLNLVSQVYLTAGFDGYPSRVFGLCFIVQDFTKRVQLKVGDFVIALPPQVDPESAGP